MSSRLIYLLIIPFLAGCQPEELGNVVIGDVTDTDFEVNIHPNENELSPLTAGITSYSKKEHTLNITIRGKYENDLSYATQLLSRSHELPLIGLYPSHNNIIIVKALDNEGRLIASEQLEWQTDSLGITLPDIRINTHDGLYPGSRLTFIEYRTGTKTLPLIFDEYGDLRWYLNFPEQSLIRPVIFNNSFDFFCGDFGYPQMYRLDCLGNGDTIPLPEGYQMMHHNVHRHNQHLFFPADKEYILETDETGRKIKDWNLNEILKRYLPGEQDLVIDGEDWLHVNSVFYDETDEALLISARQSLGVFKIDYHTGDIQWILNDTTFNWFNYPQLAELALKPADDCTLPMGQHSPVPLSGNRLLMLDNGYNGYERVENSNNKVRGGRGYSSLVVYEIFEEDRTVLQTFQYGSEMKNSLYSKFAGNAGYDPVSGTYYGLFGTIDTDNQGVYHGRVIETDLEGNVLFDAELTALNPGELFFRTEKINLGRLINDFIPGPD
jgi:arylsulfate sulfotransferase